MTREDEIRQAAEENATERAGSAIAAFCDGAKWADSHPHDELDESFREYIKNKRKME